MSRYMLPRFGPRIPPEDLTTWAVGTGQIAKSRNLIVYC